MGQEPVAVKETEPEELEQESEQAKPTCSTTEMGQTMTTLVASFSHAEANPRVTVARLIMDGQYQRAAILAGLYRVDYEEVVRECGLGDEPGVRIVVRKVTN